MLKWILVPVKISLQTMAVFLCFLSLAFIFAAVSPSPSLYFLLFYLDLSSYPFDLYFLPIRSLTKSLTHTHSYFQPVPPLIYPPSTSSTSLSVNLSVLTLLWSSTYPLFWLTRVATGAFWPLSAFLIRQSSFGYRTRAEFRLGLARGFPSPHKSPTPLLLAWLACVDPSRLRAVGQMRITKNKGFKMTAASCNS